MTLNGVPEVAPCFEEASLPQQKLIDGKVFPRVFGPNPHSFLPNAAAAAEVFGKNKQFLEEQLYEYGALFFRGFPLRSAEDFNAVLEAIGWEKMEYIGAAPRTKILDGVYTANDSDPAAIIPFHHELSQLREGWPQKILFFCEVESAEGGQTPIVVSHKVTEKMKQEFPEFTQKLEDQGWMYTKIMPLNTDSSSPAGKGWPLVWGTTDRLEAEKLATAQFDASRVEWLPDDSLKITSGLYKGTRNFGRRGREAAWFNKLVIYGSANSLPGHDVVLGDGSSVPADAMDACKKFHEDLSVAIPWRAGDLMILDNLAVMHSRRPYKPPRELLAALCK